MGFNQATVNRLTIPGNIPTRDVLAKGTPDNVQVAVGKLAETGDCTHLIPSCGGGTPPGVSTTNIRAFIESLG